MKKQGQEINEFGSLLHKTLQGKMKVQTHWATVTEVDWEAKTMTVKGTADDLEFYDVILGLGAIYVKPKVGALCLIGVILNNEAATFLIECAKIDAIEVIDKTGFKLNLNEGILTINGDAFSGIVKAPELKTQIDKNTLILEKIQSVFQNWTPVSQDGGAALKALVTQFTSLSRADLSSIENEKIKHG